MTRRYSAPPTGPADSAPAGPIAQPDASQAQHEHASERRRLTVRLPLASPPATRAGCSDLPRPCGRSCRHAIGADGERPGRPYVSTVSAPPVIKPGGGCALDAVEARPDGATPREVAAAMGERPERVRQVEVRALYKARCTEVVVEALEAARGQLPDGAELIVAYPASLDPLAIHLHVSVRVPSMVSASMTGLPRGRRRGR